MKKLDVAFDDNALQWRGALWCEPGVTLLFAPSEAIVRSIANRDEQSGTPQAFHLKLLFRSREVERYRYFPFIFQCAGSGPVAEISEIHEGDEIVAVELRDIMIDQDQKFSIAFDMEYVEPENDVAGLSAPYAGLELFEARLYPAGATHPRPATPTARLDTGAPASGRPVFVVGSGRCGTSILTWSIGQHPNIGVLEETNWLPLTLLGAAAGFAMAGSMPRNAPRVYGVTRSRFLQHIAAAFDSLHHEAVENTAIRSFVARYSLHSEFNREFQIKRSQWAPKKRWVDGAPLNTSYIEIISEAFADAQFVGIIRSPVDTINSYINFHNAGRPLVSVSEAIGCWRTAMEKILVNAKTLGPQRFLVLDYDELRANIDLQLRRCFEFLGEPNFAQAAATFGVKINSSFADGDASTTQRVDASHPAVAECDRLYKSWLAQEPLDGFLPGDENYVDWERDVVSRIVRCIS
jgi:hypothetical protein